MRPDWVAPSASALVVGAMSLVLGFALNPLSQDVSNPDRAVRLAEAHDAQWLALSVLLFLASVGLTLGLPALLSLMTGRGRFLGLVATAVFAIGTVGLAGYAMALMFLRALLLADSLADDAMRTATDDRGLVTFVGTWLACFMVGLVLIAAALWRAGTTPRWVPLVVLLFVVSQFAGDYGGDFGTVIQFLVLTVAFTGVAIAANDHVPKHP